MQVLTHIKIRKCWRQNVLEVVWYDLFLIISKCLGSTVVAYN